jgi:hypothetical protein
MQRGESAEHFLGEARAAASNEHVSAEAHSGAPVNSSAVHQSSNSV